MSICAVKSALLLFLVVWLGHPAMAEAISVSGTAYQNNETTALSASYRVDLGTEF